MPASCQVQEGKEVHQAQQSKEEEEMMALKGKRRKLDANKDGKISRADFKLLRKGRKKSGKKKR